MCIRDSSLFCLGFLFDLLSLFYGILGLVKKQHISGFPIISIVCYVIGAVLSIISSDRVFGFPIIPGLFILFFLHVVCQLPLYIQTKRLS